MMKYTDDDVKKIRTTAIIEFPALYGALGIEGTDKLIRIILEKERALNRAKRQEKAA